MNPTLYETDFHAWTENQAAALRRNATERLNLAAEIDWDHLAEEIESLGRNELRSMEGALMRIIEHLLKLRFSPAHDPRAGWLESVAVHRTEFQALSEDNPGLVRRVRLPVVYRRARTIAASSLEQRDGLPKSTLPDVCPYTLEQIAADDWYPERP